jgi:hypothetical protein
MPADVPVEYLSRRSGHHYRAPSFSLGLRSCRGDAKFVDYLVFSHRFGPVPVEISACTPAAQIILAEMER